jgi:hypothetical protein
VELLDCIDAEPREETDCEVDLDCDDDETMAPELDSSKDLDDASEATDVIDEIAVF